MALKLMTVASRCLSIFIVLALTGRIAIAQVGNYRSIVTTGNWGTATTWERDADSNGSFEESPSTVAPSIITGTVTIQAGHTITYNITGNVNSNGIITVDGIINWSGGLPQRILNVNTGGIVRNNGSINGTTPSRLKFNAGSSYDHLFSDGGTIPSAAWDVASTVNITGMGSGAFTRPGGLSQVFGNFIWNTPLFDSFIDLEGQPSTISGDMIISNTGVGAVVYNFGAGLPGNNNITLAVGGDLSVSGASQFGFTSGIGSTGSLTANASSTVGKGIKMSGGYFQIADDDNVNLTVNGLISITGGDFELSASSASVATNIFGDYIYTGGTLYSSGGVSTINFSGTSTQTVTCDQTPSGTINYVVQSNAILNIPGTNNFLSGTGGFTLSSNATLQVGSTNGSGALQLLSAGGNLRMTGTRAYANPSNIVYNGLGAQFIGNGHPADIGVNTTVNNINGVSLIVGVPAIITTNLTLSSGNLNIANGSLTLNGTLTPGSNNITIGTSGSLIINGNATLGTFPFSSGSQAFSNLTLNNSNGLNIANDVTLSGVLTLSNGSLGINNQTLTLNGTLVVSSGSLSCNSSSSLIVGGTGNLGNSLNFASGGNTLGTLTINRASAGVVEVNSTVTIANNLNLTNGQLTNTNGLNMGNGSTLTRSGGTLTSDNPDIVSGSYNVVYNSGSPISTGLELPSPADIASLNNLTISGPTLLTQNLTVNGNVSLSSGTFSCGSNTITMKGSTWARNGGSFLPGTGQVNFNGNTTITATSGTPLLGNVRVESGSTLTFYSGTTTVSGNITFIAGSTVNANGGTLLLAGTGLQTFGAGGKTLNNISVIKSGGSIDLTSSLGITGLLNIFTATAFASNGNLTLLSTSDGASGNASIGDLSAGGSVTGDVTVQRFMSGEGRVWRYLSSPIQNASVASWKDNFPITGSFSDPSTPGEWPGISPLISSSVSMYRYNETTVGTRDLGWEAFPTSGAASANPLEVGRGYSAFVRITPSSTIVDVTGPINSGDIPLPVTLTGTGGANNDNGWCIVGNPYPSSIDWDSPNWTKTNISNVVQIRDNPGGIFQTWNGSIGSMGSGRIAAGQGFWVQAVGAPTLTARETVKSNTTGAFYKQDTEVPNAFEIILSKGTEKDFAYLWFKDDATETVDAAYDAPKFNNDIFDFSILTSSGTKLAINTLPYLNCGDELKMDISTVNTLYDIEGNYTIEFGELGGIDSSIKLRLIDTYANSSMDVSDGASYNFDIIKDEVSSYGSSRFKLQLLAGSTSFSVTSTSSSASCKAGSVTIEANGAPSGGMYRWYDSNTADLPVFESTSNEFVSPDLDKSMTYFVSVADDLGCESTRTSVLAEVINYDDVVITESENQLSSSYETGNQWFKDGVLIAGANQQTYKPGESGLYTVEVNIESCTTSAERSFTVTGLEDEEFFDGMVRVYPNPVTNEVSIEVVDEIIGTPRVIDLNGKVLGEIELKRKGKHRIGTFDFRDKTEGVYLLQVSDKNGNIFNKRIVKK